MIDLDITVLDVEPEAYAAAPTLTFRLGMTESSGELIHAMAMRCQVRIEPQRRQHSDTEKAGLKDLFGPPEQWGTSLKPFQWTQESLTVPGFEGTTVVDLPVRCTYDFDVVASKYLHGLQEGKLPLVLLFSGTAFTRGMTGYSVEQLPWELEARYQLPVAVWDELIARYFGGQGWLRASQERLEQLQRFRARHGLTTWDDVLGVLLDGADAEVPA